MIHQKDPQEESPVGAEELATRLRKAMASPALSKEAKADLARMWGFARMLDSAVLLTLEDEGF